MQNEDKRVGVWGVLLMRITLMEPYWYPTCDEKPSTSPFDRDDTGWEIRLHKSRVMARALAWIAKASASQKTFPVIGSKWFSKITAQSVDCTRLQDAAVPGERPWHFHIQRSWVCWGCVWFHTGGVPECAYPQGTSIDPVHNFRTKPYTFLFSKK